MKKGKKLLFISTVILSLILSLAFVASAQEHSGSYGENLTWTLHTETGVLTISGEGTMESYSCEDSPWYSYIESIKTVIIENGVTEISDNAFMECTELTDVSIPESVSGIGDEAFWGCYSLESVNIPANVDYIDNTAFRYCDALKNINVDEENQNYKSVDGVLFTADMMVLIQYPIGKEATAYEIPDGVEEIEFTAFENGNLEEITIPDSVKKISSNAFSHCNLKSVYIPKGVVELEGAFSDNHNLSDIEVDGANSDYASVDGVLFTKNLDKIVLYPIGKTETTYEIPDTVTEIGKAAFGGANALENVIIPNSVLQIEALAFSGCDFKSIEIPESVISIDENAFYGCYNLESVTMGIGVEGINDNAFSNCTSLTDVYYDSHLNRWNRIYIGEGNEYLTQANIHFCESTNTTAVDGKEATCTQDGYTAGVYCNDCEEWVSGHEVISAAHTDENTDDVCDVCGNYMNDIELDIPKTLENVSYERVYLKFIPSVSGTYTFYSNADAWVDTFGYLFDKDKNFIISDDESGDYSNFSITYDLEAGVTYYWAVCYYPEEDETATFDVMLVLAPACEHNNTLEHSETPVSCTQDGYTAGVFCYDCETWISGHEVITKYGHEYESNDGICDICRLLLNNDSEEFDCKIIDGKAVISGYIGDGGDVIILSEIGGYKVISIGESVFFGNWPVETVTIPNGVERIEREAFAYTLIKEITFPDSIISIGASAFFSCSKLTTVHIGAGTTNIDSYAFYDCSNLKDVYYNGSQSEWNEIVIGKSNEYLTNATIHFAEVPHTHSYTSTTKSPTCTATGKTTYTCSCGDTYTETIKAKGHTVVTDKAVAATCTKTGLTAGSHCSECKAVITKQNIVAKKAHTSDKGTVTKKATYTSTGTKTYKCTTCKVTIKIEETARLTLSKVSSLKASSIGTTSLKFTWNKVTGAEKYGVYYSTNGKSWKKVTTSKNSVTVKKLKTGTTYKVKVRAVAGSNTGSYSSVLTTSTKPSKVTLSKLTSGKKKLTAQWKTISGVAGYEVTYSTSKKFTKKTTKTVTVKKAKTKKTTLKKLKSGKKYYVKVRAYKVVNGKKIYGSYSSVKTVKVK